MLSGLLGTRERSDPGPKVYRKSVNQFRKDLEFPGGTVFGGSPEDFLKGES